MNEPPYPVGTAVDHQRRALLVSRRLMPVILQVHAGEIERSAADTLELESCGVMEGDRLDPLVTALLEVMTEPTLVVTVESSGGRGLHLITIWATAVKAVVGTSSDRHHFELMQIEPGLLPFHLAQAVALRPRFRLSFAGGVSLPVAALRSAERLIDDHPREAAAELRSVGVAPVWADRLVTALAYRRALWTVESVWLGRSPHRRESKLTVLDGGDGGYWRMADHPGTGNVSLTVCDFDELLDLLFWLLPGGSPQ